MTMVVINRGSIMKSILKYVALAAIAATAFVSCQEELTTDQPEAPEVGEVQIKVTAVPEALAGVDTRTYIGTYKGTANTILWGTGEYMKLAVQAGDANPVFANSSDDSADSFDGEPQATFEFSVTGITGSCKYMGLYPASAAVANNTNAANYKVNLPAIQNATAASYDPAAYIMVAKPEEFKSVQTNWEAYYRRATALNKITLKNVPSGVSFNKVKITAEGKKLAGGRHFNLTTGEGLEVYGTDATIEVLYATALTGTNVDVWFTSWDTEIAAGEKLTIIAYTTDGKSYTKEITVPEGKTIKFQEGYLNTLGANLSGINPETSSFTEGDYVILAKNGDTYYALKGEASGTRIASVGYTGSLTNYNGDASLIWTIASSGSSYTIKNRGNYLGWTSDNSAVLVAEANYDATTCLMGIGDNGDGTYKISVAADVTRILARNQSNAYFAFYTGSGFKNLVLVPATSLEQVKTPTFSPAEGEVTSGTEITISSATNGATIYYTTDGSDPTTSSTQGTSVTITATTTIKAIAVKAGMANSAIATANYSVVSAGSITLTESDITAGENTVKGTNNNLLAYRLGTGSNDGSLTFKAGYETITFTLAGWANGTRSFSITNGEISGSSSLSPDAGGPSGTINAGFSTTYSGTQYTIVVVDPTKEVVFSGHRAVVWGFTAIEATPDNRQDAGIAWSAQTGTASLEDEDDVLPTVSLNNPQNVTVAYSSSNTNVATIDGFGSITLVGAGETTISATFDGNDTYKPATVEYTLSVTDNRSTSPTLKYTLDGTDSSQGSNGYATESEITQSSIGWIAVANTTTNPWRFGGKNLAGVDRAIFSTTAISSNISSIEVVSGTATATVNSLTITVHNTAADAASGNNAIATKTVSSDIASSTVTLTKSDATSWAGKFYRIVYKVTAGSSNQYVQFVSAKFYGTN